MTMRLNKTLIKGISVTLKTIEKYYTSTRTKEQIENVQLLR